MARPMALVASWLAAAACWAATVEIQGEVKKPNQTHGKGAHYRLVGDASFHWSRQPFTGDLDIGPHTFTMETGGGNVTSFAGVISGTGKFMWNGGGTARWQTTPSFLKGDKPNTFSGIFTILRGTVALAKPPGVDAIAGDLVLGGGSNQAIVRLDAPNQIKDTCNIRIVGKHEGRIWTQGHSETVGTLELQSHGYIDLADGASTLRFADSSTTKWDLARTLTVQGWTAGKDNVFFDQGKPGLSQEQLARVGFADPSGRAPGLYTARFLPDGQLVPGDKVQAAEPPFDLSETARAERRKVYDVPGRAALTGKATRLKDGMTVSFFGDSITWLYGYIRAIEEAVKKGEGTKDLNVTLVNRGVNGGGVLSIREGAPKAAYVDAKNRNGKQAPFADVIEADKATVAVVFIGVNDIWWRNTKPEDFDRALRDIAAAAEAHKTRLVLATLSVYQEKPDGTNPKDKAADQYAQITRTVAKDTGATLVDLRRVHLAYLRNHNAELRVDGTLKFLSTGVLTYDGVHPNARGVALLADHIALGIHTALAP